MSMLIEVTQQQRQQIVDLYQNKGYGIEKVRKELNLSITPGKVRRVLKEEGIHLRNFKEAKVGRYADPVDRQKELQIIEAYNKGWGLQKIVDELQLDFGFDKVRRILLDNNIHIRNVQEAHEVMIVKDLRKFVVNDNYNLLSHNGAWLMGFIAADGYLPNTKGARNRITISLAEKDKEILEKIAQEIEYYGNIHTYTSSYSPDKKFVSLSFASKQIREQLEKYGIVNNKTFLLKHLPDLPEELKLDFIAGLFDGDGSLGIGKDGRLFLGLTSANKELLVEIENFLHDKYLLPTHHVYTDHTVYALRYSGKKDVLKLATLFYNNDYLRLQRKREKYYLIREQLPRDSIPSI